MQVFGSQLHELPPKGLCGGNTYTTTLHVLNSLIVKLSKLTKAEKVYRGVSGGRLPESFRSPNRYNVRGGIDSAFMSTTLNRDVAVGYAGAVAIVRPSLGLGTRISGQR